MTNRQLKAFLDSLTEEQLDQEIKISSPDRGYSMMFSEIIQEDHINPSGEGAEPISAYINESPEDDWSEEPVVIHKGEIMYFID